MLVFNLMSFIAVAAGTIIAIFLITFFILKKGFGRSDALYESTMTSLFSLMALLFLTLLFAGPSFLSDSPVFYAVLDKGDTVRVHKLDSSYRVIWADYIIEPVNKDNAIRVSAEILMPTGNSKIKKYSSLVYIHHSFDGDITSLSGEQIKKYFKYHNAFRITSYSKDIVQEINNYLLRLSIDNKELNEAELLREVESRFSEEVGLALKIYLEE